MDILRQRGQSWNNALLLLFTVANPCLSSKAQEHLSDPFLRLDCAVHYASVALGTV